MFTQQDFLVLAFSTVATILWNMLNVLCYGVGKIENEPLFRPNLSRTMAVLLAIEVVLFLYLIFIHPNLTPN